MTNQRGKVEDLYPLTPMQQGMLFHALYAPDSGVYVQQVDAELTGTLDPGMFRRTWQALVDRHPVLRTAFEWERRADPFQVVYRTATLPWTDHDWSMEAPSVQTQRLDALRAEDRAHGFALDRPPLLRMALIRIAANRWRLLWTHHHLILDGWSVPLLLQDLFALHHALSEGSTPALEPRRPFRDHVAWIRAQSRDAAQAFWTSALAGLEAAAPLPSKARLGGGRAFVGRMDHVSTRLAAAPSAALAAFARTHDLTVSSVLQGAWAVVLSRFTDTTRALYGATVAGRPPALSGSERMIGLFINTVVVRATVPPAALVVEWLRELQARLAGLREFEHTPLVDALAWGGVGSDQPAFESLFVFENYPVDATVGTGVAGLAIDGAEAHEQTNFPLTLVAVPGDEIFFKIDFDAGRFEPAMIARLLGGLVQVLGTMVERPGLRLGQLIVVTESDQDRLSAGNRAAASSLPRSSDQATTHAARFVHAMIDDQAARQPEAPAIGAGEHIVTFGALRDRSDAIATALAARRIGPEHRVGIELSRSAALVVAILGVLKAGAAYVPIERSHPAARRAHIAADAKVSLVVVESADDHSVYEGINVALLDELEHHTSGSSRARLSPDGLAYVLYTSGSTGTPKGVMVTHGGLANYVEWAIDAYAAASGNGAPLHSPLGFDLTITSIFPTLAAGRPVQLVPEQDGIEGLAKALAGSPDFSLVKITPAHLDALRALLPTANATSATRAFVIGGEALSHEQLDYWRACAPGTKLVNEYGPTETVVGCAVYDAAGDAGAQGMVPIGGPIANAALYVLDRAWNLAPPGATGELFIGGDGVARGYQNRPDLTAERFLPDPWARQPGARMYRSGDLARVREDGLLEFLGRNDEQIKIRGYRIEPGEIEAALEAHSQVQAAAVFAARTTGSSSASDTTLIAYVVTDDDVAADLRGWLRERLPEHLIPARVMRVERLPLTINGKVDRAALLAMAADQELPRASAYEAPRGPREELLALVWADVLGASRVGRHDNFFDLGGHSLIATRLVARLRRLFGQDTPLRAIFERPTIATLAAHLSGDEDRITADDGIAPRPAAEPPVLSLAQERLWFLHELDPQSPAYVVPAALWIDGPLDVQAFRAALSGVVERHEALRTRIASVDGRAVASIAAAEIPITVMDLESLASDAQVDEVVRLAAHDALTPFDLAAQPLIRATLIRLGAARHALLLATHHLVSDAWSTEVLVRDVAAFYQSHRHGTATPLPPLRVQYADVARWQRERMNGPEGAHLTGYWQAKLASVPSLDLPVDRPASSDASLRGASTGITLDAAATTALVALARREQATPFMAYLAVFELLLSGYANQEDFVLGTPVAGRDRPELEPLIGLFINTVAVRSDVAGAGSFTDLLARIRATTLDAFAHQELPFERLVDALRPSRDLGHQPIVRVMFTLQHEAAPVEIAGLRFTAIAGRTTTSKFDLTLAVTETATGWNATIEYRSDLFDAETIRQMARHYASLVSAAAARPDVALRSLPLLGENERAHMLTAWNDTAYEPGASDTVPEIFQLQVARSPAATAVAFEDDTLSYQELNHRAAQLARQLVAAGVGADAIVGVFLERSVDLVVALLAVHKAGAAYAPLDPAYPRDRLALMIEDAAGSLVLTTAALVDRLPPGVRVHLVDQVDRAGATEPDVLLPRPLPESLAYVIFTSGSTGRPKGVMISHRALANHMRWMQRRYPLTASDRVLQKTAASFDASVWEFFAPLISGATLVVARPGGQQDPDYLIDTIGAHRVTILQVVPSLLRLLVEHERFGTCTSLRRIFAGGEALTTELARRLFAVSGAELVNLYGPTEATIDSVTWTCPRDAAAGPSTGMPIGLPIDNTTAHVLDAWLEPVPLGVTGELYLGGAALGRGYLAQPALTAERFLPDPFAAAPGGRLYRTGDRVRRHRSGVLEYLGRADAQVKLRGFRIELAEIERAIESHQSVQQAAVVVRDRSGSQQLVAYVVARDGVDLDEAAVRSYIHTRLPEFMMPAVLVSVDVFPTLPNGKIDRQALPAPEGRQEESAHVAPRNEKESTLAAVWTAVLRVPRVGVHDNFFALGGDSILSLQVVARARKDGLTITPAQLFLHQTVAALAAVATASAPAAAPAAPPENGAVPLTPVQQWFFALPLEARHHWNQAMLLQVPPRLDRAAIKAALSDVVSRHDALRLCFVQSAGTWRQEIVAAMPAALAVIDLSAEATPGDVIDTHIAHVQASMDLATPPLLRAAWFDYGDRRAGRLLLAAHHLVVDGVSWRILLEDLQTAYTSRLANSTPVWPPATATFQAWSQHLAALAAAGTVQEEAGYWRRQVEADAGWGSHDIAGGANDMEGSARHLDLDLPADVTETLLRDVHGAYNTQMLDVLIAALADALALWDGARVVTIELEGHGRDVLDIDVSRTVGWFTTLFPVRLDTRDAATRGRLLRTVKEQLRAVPRKGLGYGVLRYLGDGAAFSAVPHAAPAISFNYLGRWVGAESSPLEEATAPLHMSGFGAAPEQPVSLRDPGAQRTHAIEVVAGVVDGSLRVRWIYSEPRQSRDTMARLAGHYRRSLDTLITHCLDAGQAGYTPADFTASDLNQQQLDKLLAKLRGA